MVTASREVVGRVTCVAASVQAAHICDRGLGPLSLDLQRLNERVFSVNDNSVRIPFDSESHSELPGHFSLTTKGLKRCSTGSNYSLTSGNVCL